MSHPPHSLCALLTRHQLARSAALTDESETLSTRVSHAVRDNLPAQIVYRKANFKSIFQNILLRVNGLYLDLNEETRMRLDALMDVITRMSESWSGPQEVELGVHSMLVALLAEPLNILLSELFRPVWPLGGSLYWRSSSSQASGGGGGRPDLVLVWRYQDMDSGRMLDRILAVLEVKTLASMGADVATSIDEAVETGTLVYHETQVLSPNLRLASNAKRIVEQVSDLSLKLALPS